MDDLRLRGAAPLVLLALGRRREDSEGALAAERPFEPRGRRHVLGRRAGAGGFSLARVSGAHMMERMWAGGGGGGGGGGGVVVVCGVQGLVPVIMMTRVARLCLEERGVGCCVCGGVGRGRESVCE